MKLVQLLPPLLFVTTLLPSCATLNEPSEHLAACHTSDGMLINTPECIKTHNDIISERQKRQSRVLDYPLTR